MCAAQSRHGDVKFIKQASKTDTENMWDLFNKKNN